MSRTQKVVNDLIQWGKTCGLKFNPEKTVCIIFNKAKQITSYPNKLLVSGQQVEFSTTTKYLGVHLDHKLLWTTHITQALKKAKAYLFMILKNVNTRFGPKANLTKWVYISIVRPRILYAYYVWGHKACKTETLQALQRLNNLACKMITPVRRTTPRKSLEVIYDILPLDLQGQLEAISAQKNARILTLKWSGHNPGKKTYIGHRYHWSTVILTLNADNNQTSDRIKETNPPQRYTVNTDSLTNTAKPTESQINIYTDGSLTDEHAGSGYTIQYKKRELIADSIRLPIYAHNSLPSRNYSNKRSLQEIY